MTRKEGKRVWTLVLVPPHTREKTRQVSVGEKSVIYTLTIFLTFLMAVFITTRETSQLAVARTEQLARSQRNVVNLLDSVQMLDGIVADERAGLMAPLNMVMPVRGTISSPFSLSRLHPILDIFRAHKGVDLSAPYGANIQSPAKGRVKFVGWSVGHGKIVDIEHSGGVVTRLAHCLEILVHQGDSVKRGQVVAKVGTTGLTTGPHLHFEITARGRNLDPIQYLMDSRASCAR